MEEEIKIDVNEPLGIALNESYIEKKIKPLIKLIIKLTKYYIILNKLNYTIKNYSHKSVNT